MGWDRIGKGREGEVGLLWRSLPTRYSFSLSLSLSLGYPPVPTYLTRLCMYAHMYTRYIFHLSHLQVLIFIDNFQISSYLYLTLLR